MTVLRMNSLLDEVSMPREASRANQLGSMNDPLFHGMRRASESAGAIQKATHILPQSQE
jgi:hypothetical protein